VVPLRPPDPESILRWQRTGSSIRRQHLPVFLRERCTRRRLSPCRTRQAALHAAAVLLMRPQLLLRRPLTAHPLLRAVLKPLQRRVALRLLRQREGRLLPRRQRPVWRGARCTRVPMRAPKRQWMRPCARPPSGLRWPSLYRRSRPMRALLRSNS